MSPTTSLLHQTIAAFPAPPVDVASSSDQSSRTVVLPNLGYPLRPSTYMPRKSRTSDVLTIKRTSHFRNEVDFVYAQDVGDNSGHNGVRNAFERDRCSFRRFKKFFWKNASKAVKRLQKLKANFCRGIFF